jgi:hypothetical protein
MPTYKELVDEVALTMNGYVGGEADATYLSSPIGTSDTSFTVADATIISTGLIEIDDELMWVLSKIESSGSLTLHPAGRGWLSTTAATHAANAVVKANPPLPRKIIKNAINDTMRGTWPALFRVAQTSITALGARLTYSLPAEAQDALNVSWQTPGPTQRWSPVRRYRVDKMADTTAFPTGKTIDIMEDVVPGRRISVTYSAVPNPLVNDTDDFVSITGLVDSARDVVVLGTVARLLGYQEAHRIQGSSIEASERGEDVPVGASVNASKYIYSLYLQRREEERQELLRRYPPRGYMAR